MPATEHALRGSGGGGGGGGDTAGHHVKLVLDFNKTNKLKEEKREKRRKDTEETRTRENKIKTNACASADAMSTSSGLYAVRFMLCAVVLLIVPVQLLARLQPRL